MTETMDCYKCGVQLIPNVPHRCRGTAVIWRKGLIDPYDATVERRRTERRGAGMAPQEIAELSSEAGRPLNEAQAEAYRRRKIEWDGVERRIAERRKP